MTEPVTYEQTAGVATITMDDGKVNVMSPTMLAGLADAFARARADGAVTILTGRSAVFSAGYDMAVFDRPIEEIAATIRTGGELVEQILSHPLPVIAACNGHAVAQGAFVLLACDVRIGVRGGARIGLNEVAIGLTIPHYGVEVARHQLSPVWFDHATLTGTLYTPDEAATAGFLHELVDTSALEDIARDHARRLADLDMAAHAGTKARVRRAALDAIRQGLAEEFG